MLKKRKFSTKHNFKTWFLSKLFFIFGMILLITSLLLFAIDSISILIIDQNTIESLFSFSLIFIAVGIILHFLYMQFVKLDEIAQDIENTMEKLEEN